MKQHIDLNQLNELSEKAKERLANWSFKPIMRTIKPLTTLLSIGQMIEFLSDNESMVMDVEINKGKVGGYMEGKMFHDTELVDALWEAVKEVLEK